MSFREKEKKFDGSGYDSDLIEILERWILQKCPDECLDNIVGLEDAKKLLKEAVVSPVGPKSILLVGPPETGKTKLAKAVISECKTTFFDCTSAPRFFGKSEKSVRLLLEEARFYAPSTIFFDMINYYPEYTRRVKELLMEMKGITSTEDEVVTVLATSNLDEPIDEDLIRSFDKIIYIPLLNAAGRQALMKRMFRGAARQVSPDVDFEEVANSLEGYSGRYVKIVCQNAMLMGVKRRCGRAYMRIRGRDLSDEELSNIYHEAWKRPVTPEDFTEGINDIEFSWLHKPDLEKYESWRAKFASP